MSQQQLTIKTPSVARLWFVLGVLGVMLLLLAFRAFDLHVLQHEFLANQGEKRNLRSEPLAAHRGVIYDRTGSPLAVSTPVTTLWGNPSELVEHRQEWQRLRHNKVVSAAKIADMVRGRENKKFVYLARGLAPLQAQSVLAEGVPGIYSRTEYRRYYPAGEVTSHVIGFTNIDDQGQEGLELALNDSLKGVEGRRKYVRDNRNRVIQGIEVDKEARPGTDVTLSIDLRLQYIAYRELLAAVKKSKAAGGSVVVLDAHTGEILAMVNQPSFNPNNREGVQVGALRNRAVTDMFEPGSTIKPLTIAAAMEEGLLKASSTVDTTPGTLKVANKLIRDARNYGVIDIPTILAKSSNVATTKVALIMDDQALPAFMRRFGFGATTGVAFPGEAKGSLPYRQHWREIERATLSYGYGVSVTALQLARAYGVLANNGNLLPATLIKQEQPLVGEQIIDAEHANDMVRMLEGVVNEGTASRARVPGYRIAGKTGTVRKLTNGSYEEDKYLAMFAGIAPAENPRIVTVVVVDEPKEGGYYGGLVAAPVFAQIMSGVLPMLNIEPHAPEPIYASSEVSAQGGQL